MDEQPPVIRIFREYRHMVGGGGSVFIGSKNSTAFRSTLGLLDDVLLAFDKLDLIRDDDLDVHRDGRSKEASVAASEYDEWRVAPVLLLAVRSRCWRC